MEVFTPWLSTIGGLIIGLSTTILLVSLGRICGISGIVEAVVTRPTKSMWQLWFMIGLVAAGFLAAAVDNRVFENTTDSSWLAVAAAGVIVGYGTRLGGGCTSGHGVCGIPRFSARSIIATLIFMFTGGVTVYLVRHIL